MLAVAIYVQSQVIILQFLSFHEKAMSKAEAEIFKAKRLYINLLGIRSLKSYAEEWKDWELAYVGLLANCVSQVNIVVFSVIRRKVIG